MEKRRQTSLVSLIYNKIKKRFHITLAILAFAWLSYQYYINTPPAMRYLPIQDHWIEENRTRFTTVLGMPAIYLRYRIPENYTQVVNDISNYVTEKTQWEHIIQDKQSYEAEWLNKFKDHPSHQKLLGNGTIFYESLSLLKKRIETQKDYIAITWLKPQGESDHYRFVRARVIYDNESECTLEFIDYSEFDL